MNRFAYTTLICFCFFCFFHSGSHITHTFANAYRSAWISNPRESTERSVGHRDMWAQLLVLLKRHQCDFDKKQRAVFFPLPFPAPAGVTLLLSRNMITGQRCGPCQEMMSLNCLTSFSLFCVTNHSVLFRCDCRCPKC